MRLRKEWEDEEEKGEWGKEGMIGGGKRGETTACQTCYVGEDVILFTLLSRQFLKCRLDFWRHPSLPSSSSSSSSLPTIVILSSGTLSLSSSSAFSLSFYIMLISIRFMVILSYFSLSHQFVNFYHAKQYFFLITNKKYTEKNRTKSNNSFIQF